MCALVKCDMKRGYNKRKYYPVKTNTPDNKNRLLKVEFSKLIVIWAVTFTMLCVSMSYLLAFLERDSVSDVTVMVVSACIGIVASYMAKSFAEKNSRNKYGIDKAGNKICEDDSDEIAAG